MMPRLSRVSTVGAVLLIPSLLSALPCEAFQSRVFRSTSTRRCSSTRYVLGDPAKDTTPENHTTGGTSSSNNNGGWSSASPDNEDIPILTEWRINGRDHLVGKVVNHPRFGDGSVIALSKLKDTRDGGGAAAQEGAVVTTETGSRYKLDRAASEEDDVVVVDPASQFFANGSAEDAKAQTVDLDTGIGAASKPKEEAEAEAEQNAPDEEEDEEDAAARALLKRIEERNRRARARLEHDSFVKDEVKKFKTLRERMDYEQAQREHIAAAQEGAAQVQGEEEKQDSSDTENKKEFRTLRERFDYEHGNRRTIY